MEQSHKNYIREADLNEFPIDFFEFCLTSDPSLVFVATQGANVVGSIIA